MVSAGLAGAGGGDELLLAGGALDQHHTLLHIHAQIADPVRHQSLAVAAQAGVKQLLALGSLVKVAAILVADEDPAAQLHKGHFAAVRRPHLVGDPLVGMLHIPGAHIALLHIAHKGALEGIALGLVDVEDQVLIRGADPDMTQPVVTAVDHLS